MIMESKVKESLIQIEGFVKELSKFSDLPLGYSPFSSLVRSSLIKNYEFLKLVYLKDNFESYFFVTSFLRSIVEDIIVLESVHYFPLEKREKILQGIQFLEANERILKQWDFFQKYRPFQPVINRAYEIEERRLEIQSIWQENGWPKFEAKPKKLMPPTIELAQKLAPGILDILYEFIYRLSSSSVHFSSQTLLRMGWGNVDKENNLSGTISVNHMANYYKTFCQIYGALLFSFYFEFFSEEIGSTETEQALIVNIRKSLLSELRWPEMITFEEMNLPVPNAYHDQILTYGMTHITITEMLKDGFTKSNFEKFHEALKNISK
jgi:hypothetical protein